MKFWFGLITATCVSIVGCQQHEASDSVLHETGKDFPAYGGNAAGNRYSPLSQINASNVNRLKVAWIYDPRDPADTANKEHRGRETQCQPIVVDGIMYGTSAELCLFAVEAGTGKQLWKFKIPGEMRRFNSNRGVMYWRNGADKRIFFTAGSFMYSVDAMTGKQHMDFGEQGTVDLHVGLAENVGHDVQDLSVTATSPGVIFKNTLVLGSSVSEAGDAAPGHVRGFDVLTGKLKWVFHTIPQPGEFGYDTWPKDAYKKIGAANNWSGMVLDEKRGMVYFGTGAPSSDFYGGAREGKNLFANCVLALEAETGKMKWYFQTIHHDIWDRDIPCPPNLTTIEKDGKKRDVVVQATKDGIVYVLDRDSGTSIFPIEEKPVPVNGLPGEKPYPLQKFPVKPKPFIRQTLTENDLTDISPEANAWARAAFKEFGNTPGNKFSPPNETGTLLFGYSGGAEWGGNAIDPDGVLYLNANEDAWLLKMISIEGRNKELAALSVGNSLYITNCAACHGADRKGSGTEFPNLVGIGKRKDPESIAKVIKTGSGRMPSFQHLSDMERQSIVDFLMNVRRTDDHGRMTDTISRKTEFPYIPDYVTKEWRRWRDKDGYNAIKPPWGTLNALDLSSGEWLWRVPLGEFPELTKKGIPITGTETYGGPLVTAGGLLFIASTQDERIRAFEMKTGKRVWEYQLPAGGFATPITYEVDGKQYVAIAAGGARGQKLGGWYLAFAL